MPLEEFLGVNVLAFMLVFVRVGTAVMIMPGIGDSFVSQKVRLLAALAISFVMFPLFVDKMPNPIPSSGPLLILITVEFIAGLFYGTIARIFMSALDVAGMVVSFASSLSNAQIFNPSLSAQGSLVGAFLSVTGVVFLFSTDMHHLLIMGVVESYSLFPFGQLPETGSMAELVAKAVATSFLIGVQIGAPFIVMTYLIYVGMGVLSRLMPQVQVFILALPVQILLALMTLSLVLSVALSYWIAYYERSMVFFLGGG